jgi:hypothetical protein
MGTLRLIKMSSGSKPPTQIAAVTRSAASAPTWKSPLTPIPAPEWPHGLSIEPQVCTGTDTDFEHPPARKRDNSLTVRPEILTPHRPFHEARKNNALIKARHLGTSAPSPLRVKSGLSSQLYVCFTSKADVVSRHCPCPLSAISGREEKFRVMLEIDRRPNAPHRRVRHRSFA